MKIGNYEIYLTSYSPLEKRRRKGQAEGKGDKVKEKSENKRQGQSSYLAEKHLD